MKNIKFSLTKTNKAKSIQHFFKNVFTKSEGKKEGNIVSTLSFKLAKLIDEKNIIHFGGKVFKTVLRMGHSYVFIHVFQK